jgi:Spy/CpxP family protein refolding chaperone
MKKRSLILIASLVAVVLIAAPFVLHAQNRRGGHFGGPGMHQGFGGAAAFLGHLRQLKEELDLSDAQSDQIHAILRDTHRQNAQYREQMHGGYMSVVQTLIANPNDVAAAQARLDQQTEAERALKANLLASASKALNVLTPEQRTKLGTLLAEHSARRRARH